MFRTPRDSIANKKTSGDKTKTKTKPKVALKRTSATPATATSNADTTSVELSNAHASSGSARKPKRPTTKLRAPRERRARDRSMDDDDDLEHKFSNLSVAAPAFVPGNLLAGTSAAGTTTNAQPSAAAAPSLLNGRSLAFVTDRNSNKTKATEPTAASNPSLSRSVTPTNVERRPRRQRIGALGFAKSTGSSSGSSGIQGRVTRQSATAAGANAATARSLSLKPRLTDDGAATSDSAFSQRPRSNSGGSFTQRPRSDSNGSDSDGGSDDDVYPDDPIGTTSSSSSNNNNATSAFPDRLTLFAQQKHIPKKVSRDVVIDTVFTALFGAASSSSRSSASSRSGGFSAFGDDTGTDNDDDENAPRNEEFVKRSLAASLFKDSFDTRLFTQHTHETQQQAVDRFLTPSLLHTLVTEVRFEDFRTASARIDILRAIHRNFATKRLIVARALADATTLRCLYVESVTTTTHALSSDKSVVVGDNRIDHSHGLLELLRYAIEHASESVATAASDPEASELLRNYMVSLLALWQTHWLDPAGSDDEELISCAGQFVAYVPQVTVGLLQRLLQHWPQTFPAMEVVAIRMVARVVMSSPPLVTLDATGSIQRKLFKRLARCVQSLQTQVAQEALAFTGCQFALVHFLGRYDAIYKVVTEAFHNNSQNHWHDGVRATSERHFDKALDYAP